MTIASQDFDGAIFAILTWVLAGLAVAMVSIVSWGFAVALALFHLSITFLFPWWMVKLQKLKK